MRTDGATGAWRCFRVAATSLCWAAWRLAIIKHAQKVTGNVAMTCRYYGISRQVFYTWLRRYQAEHTSHLDDETSHFDDVDPRRQPK